MKMTKTTTLEVLNTETGKTIKLGRSERRLRDKISKAKEKPLSSVEISKLRTEHIYKIKSIMKPLEFFMDELLDGWIHYIIEKEKEVPIVTFSDGKQSYAGSSFDLCFEYCYQIMRFTKSPKAVEYQDEALGVKVYIRAFCREGEEILKSEILKVKDFLENTKEILFKVHYDVARRVRDEMHKITDPKVKAGESFTSVDLRKWLEDLGR